MNEPWPDADLFYAARNPNLLAGAQFYNKVRLYATSFECFRIYNTCFLASRSIQSVLELSIHILKHWFQGQEEEDIIIMKLS